ncbi:MAG: single-stranded DNA-binding protein [Patescibacteria group bacterium]
MYALNRAQLIGHLTEDPQIRQTPSGQTVGDLNIVTRASFSTGSGQTQLSSSYHNVVVWRGLADIAQRFLKKGSQVYISGRIQTDEWEDQSTGQKRYKTRITADEMILLDPKVPNATVGEKSLVGGALNQAEVIGNVTRDPELRQTPNGNSVVSFGIATNFTWKDRAGESQEKTEFHNIVAWDELAKAIQASFKKGRKVYIRGRLQTRSWETPDGNKRYTTEIVAEGALALGVPNAEIGTPSVSTDVTLSQPIKKDSYVPNSNAEVPAVNYESEVKPEDLPF